jgi:hypothetical protein
LPGAAREGRRYEMDFGINTRKPCGKQLVNECGAGPVKYPG